MTFVLERLKTPQDVERFCKAVLTQRPERINTYGQMLSVQGRISEFIEAIKLIRQAIGPNPRPAQVRNDFGVALQALKRFTLAIQQYRAAASASGIDVYGRPSFCVGPVLRTLEH
jgi:Tfp pilus assembly protein PilF